MQRLHIFLIILIVAVGILLSIVAISLYLSATASSFYQSSWIGQMGQSMGIGRSTNNGNGGGMGGMMGGNGTPTAANTLWIIPAVLIAAAVIGIIGFGFYMLFPEIRNTRKTCEPTKKETSMTTMKPSATDSPISNAAPNSCEVILKTMTPEEQIVLNTLIAHQGKYLQKYVVKEAGLSRLKTHRIVARFAERGIVTVKPVGNTNEVTVQDWIKGAKVQDSN